MGAFQVVQMARQKSLRFSLFALLSIFLLGCSDPVPIPSDKAEYVGLWVASDRYISIFAHGQLEYREKLGFGMHNRTAGNFTFEDQAIDVAVKRFVIDVPPYVEDGQWKMKMEGIVYLRKGPPIKYGRSQKWPEGVD